MKVQHKLEGHRILLQFGFDKLHIRYYKFDISLTPSIQKWIYIWLGNISSLPQHANNEYCKHIQMVVIFLFGNSVLNKHSHLNRLG